MKSSLRRQGLRYPILLLLITLSIPACADDADNATTAAPTTETPPIATSTSEIPDATTITTSAGPASTVSTTTEPVAVSTCPTPPPLPVGALPEWVAILHAHAALLADETNMLGTSLSELEDFSQGWHQREPVASALAAVESRYDDIRALADSVLADAGGSWDEEGGIWQFDEYPDHLSQLEELWDTTVHYRDEVVPAWIAAASSRAEAISYFNSGGPCATGMWIGQLTAFVAEAVGQ